MTVTVSVQIPEAVGPDSPGSEEPDPAEESEDSARPDFFHRLKGIFEKLIEFIKKILAVFETHRS